MCGRNIAKPQPSHTPVMVCIARANRVAIQKILPTRNLRIGHPQNAGWRLRYVRIIKTKPCVKEDKSAVDKTNPAITKPKKEKELMA